MIPVLVRQQVETIKSICYKALSELGEWQDKQDPPDETVGELVRTLACQRRKLEQLHASPMDEGTWTSEQFAHLTKE